MSENLNATSNIHTQPPYPNSDQHTLPVHIYLGGSFDPVHISHIMMLNHVYQSVQAHNKRNDVKAYFLPTSRSPLKEQTTSPEHRLAMLKLVTHPPIDDLDLYDLDNLPGSKMATEFEICEHELWQSPPTYSIDTLQFLSSRHPNQSIIFVVGADNIASLAKWRDGDKLTEHAHIWIIGRDELQSMQDIKALLPKSLKNQITTHHQALTQYTHGKIFIDNYSVKAISSSEIRHAIATKHTAFAKSALPRHVYSYIMANNLYQKS